MVKEDGSLYLLVTDLGFLDQVDVVWESLDSVQGDTVFVDKQFKVLESRGRQILDISFLTQYKSQFFINLKHSLYKEK